MKKITKKWKIKTKSNIKNMKNIIIQILKDIEGMILRGTPIKISIRKKENGIEKFGKKKKREKKKKKKKNF